MKINIGIENIQTFKSKLFQWLASQYDPQRPICYLDNNQHDSKLYPQNQGYECLLALDALAAIEVLKNATNNLEQLRRFANKQQGKWIFGSLSYDFKNDLERLRSKNEDYIQWALLHFFVPKTLFLLDKKGNLQIESTAGESKHLYDTISHIDGDSRPDWVHRKVALKAKLQPSTYMQNVRKIKDHIIAGDLYEMNYCQEFYAPNVKIYPFQLFPKLNRMTRAPFAAFYHWNQHFLLCGSPERFLKKEGQQLTAQPIKGTTKRGKNTEEDKKRSQTLSNSLKDRAENVMIVDLMRNDLAKICETGSIKVPELFGIYPFAQVFQMISTVEGTVKKELDWVDILAHSFPMGSMTGTPKIMSMQLIEQYEVSKRGLYSGSVGYIQPNGNFDFNVIIRSILYNAFHKYLSVMVGGAIVYDSVPEQEYEECLMKIQGILETLSN